MTLPRVIKYAMRDLISDAIIVREPRLCDISHVMQITSFYETMNSIRKLFFDESSYNILFDIHLFFSGF